MRFLAELREKTAGFWQPLLVRFNKKPIDDLDMLAAFLRTRSAYIAQTSLFGYLKTRMGTQYVKVFEDPVFGQSINLAKWHVFAACLSDLTVFAVALVQKEGRNAMETQDLANYCYAAVIRDALGEAEVDLSIDDAIEAFVQRGKDVNWPNASQGESAFTLSPATLFQWAPIADQLKRHDEEIVRNSIRYRWRDVRDQLRRRIRPEGVWSSWRERAAQD